MASYNARIDLDVRIEKAFANINKLQSRIEKIGQTPINIERNITREVDSAIQSFQRLGRIVRSTGIAIAGLGGAGALGSLFNTFSVITKADVGAIGNAFKAVTSLDNALINLAGNAPLATAGIAATTAAALAFAPQIARAAADTIRLGKALGFAKGPLKALGEYLGTSSAEGPMSSMTMGFGNLEKAVEAYRQALFETSETVSELSRRQRSLQDNLNRFNSSSETAAKIARKLVDVNARLNDELREQADLIRRASGVNVTELEASKGRQSIQTRQNAEAFRLKQLSEQEAVYQAIAKLNERDGTALQEKLNIQRNITNQVSLEAQRRESAEQRTATGLSQRIPTPYRTAGSMGFPVALPEIEQDRKIRAREQAKQAAERTLSLQKSNSLLTEGVTLLQLKVALAEKLNGAYGRLGEIIGEQNRRQSQLFRARSNRAQRQELGGENLQRLERINKLATNNVLQEQLKNKVALAGNAIKKNEFTVAKQIGKEIDQLLEAEDQRIDRARRVLRFRQRERQETRAIAKERARSRKEALGSGIIGGAFPLLFGQGVGAAVGGGAGGAAGGLVGGQFGFGLSLVGTALGTSFDALIEGAKELGAALNPLTADISAITKASGLSGSKLEKLILDLEKTGDAAGALSLATKELEKVVGQRGVEALKEFSQTTQDLSNDFEVFLTKFKAFMADVFNTLLVPRAEVELKKRGEAIAAARKSTDPQIQSAIRELDDASSIEERVAAQDKILRLVEAEVEAKKVSVQIDRDSIQIANMQIALEEGLLEVERLGADIKDKSVQKQLEINLKLQYTIEQQKLINQLRSDEADFLVITAKLQGLQVKYQKELAALQNRINKPTGRGRGTKPPESRALSLQRDILRERLNLFNVDEQIARVGLDRLDILQREEQALLIRRDTEIKFLEFARQDALNKSKVKEDETFINQLYDARLAKVIKSAELAAKENALVQERVRAEQQIADLRAAAGFDPLALVDRTQPYGMYGAPEKLMDFSTGAELNAIVKQEVALARVLEKYKEIGQAAQLTSELVTTGFLDMVTGTKSVEEVFADFLRNLAEMLMKTAQQMIAQYIAIGIARAFALGQSPAIGTRASDFNLTGFGNLESIGGNVFAGFADGGNPPVGRPSIVGERGPELFVPKSSGTIVPNHALGGGGVKVETINITVENTGESLSPKAQKQIAGQVQGIVLSTLANERRSGGML
jgi:hypothetical protein